MRKEFHFILIMFLFVSFLGYGQVQNALSDPWIDYASGEYNIFPNIMYSTASNTDLKLDFYQPKDWSKPLPVLMLFHGGGWVAGQKERNTFQLLPYLSMG